MNNKKTVLIIEDSELIINRLKNLIGDANLAVVVGFTNNGDEALDLIAFHKPSIIFLDLSLPGKGGVEILEMVKNKFPAIAVIVLTNYSEPHYRKQCDELGVDAFFDKSTEFQMAVDFIATLG